MQALVIAGHGSHLNPDSSVPTFAHAERIRAEGVFDEVRETFWKEEPSFREIFRTLASDVAYVVPLFISEGYFTEQVLPRELRIDRNWPGSFESLERPFLQSHPTDVDLVARYCQPVGTHDAMTDVVVSRAESVTGDPNVGTGVGLAIVGHGTRRNKNSARVIHYHADQIHKRGRFDEVHALFMDEEPEITTVYERFESHDIVIVPMFIADGYHTQEDIPRDIGITTGSTGEYDASAVINDRRVWYAGAVGTEPRVADVVLERAAEAGAAIDDDVSVSTRANTQRGRTDG